MVILWAEFALLQAWLLPGWAVTSRRRELPLADRLLLAAPLSATLNALLVELLTLLHAYNRVVLVALALAEVALIVWNERRPAADTSRMAAQPFALARPWDGLVLLLTVCTGLVMLAQAADQSRVIYQAWDAILVWNPWAKEWFAGHFPTRSWHYPQLLPALMSIPYVAVQDDRLEQLSKWVTVVIPLLGLATGLRMAVLSETRRTLVTVIVLVAIWRFNRLVGPQQAYGGMADVPVAYMVLSCAYAFQLAWRSDDEHRRGLLALAGLVCAGALLTKLTAMLGAGIVLAWIEFRRRQGVSLKAVWKELAVCLAVVAVVAGHWYLYKEYQIRAGRDESEVGYVTSIVQLPWYGKLTRGWALLWESSRRYMLPAAGLSLVALRSTLGRWVVLVGVLPAFVGWALMLSYDARNFAVGVVPLSAAVVIGADELLKALRHFLGTMEPMRTRFRIPLVAGAAALVLVASAVVALRFPRERLVSSAISQKRSLGDRDVNDMLYRILPTLAKDALVGTDYQALRYLPDLESRYTLIHCESPAVAADGLRRTPVGYYLLRRKDCHPALDSVFASALASGNVRKLDEMHDHVLYQLLRPAPVIAALDSSAVGR